MTKRECAIVMAYTGVVTLQGEDLMFYCKYIEELLEKDIFTHEIPDLYLKIKEKSASNFAEMCLRATED